MKLANLLITAYFQQATLHFHKYWPVYDGWVS